MSLSKDRHQHQQQQQQLCDSPTTSDIRQFYEGSTIFITGATGFLGQVLLFKLLTACTNVKMIYLLVRGKANSSPSERFEQLFSPALKEKLTVEFPDYKDKIKLMAGDCMQSGLGLSEFDLATIINEVEIIFHVAATVRFNAPLQDAVQMNICSTKDLLNIAKTIKHLKVFAHVSTAFSNCVDRTEVYERFYDPPILPDKLITLVKELDADIIDKITPHLLNLYPNTYVYTKAIAEDLCRSNWQDLPVFVFRPAIVISSAKEPLPGWINNLNGPIGIILAVGVGLLRSIHIDQEKITNLVPCDYVINCLLASAFDVAKNWKKQPRDDNDDGRNHTIDLSTNGLCRQHRKSHHFDEDDVDNDDDNIISAEVSSTTDTNWVAEYTADKQVSRCAEGDNRYSSDRIYNFSSSGDNGAFEENRVTWKRFIDINLKVEQDYPFSAAFRPVSFTLNKYRFLHIVYCMLFHLIPAFFLDTFNRIRGVESKLLSQYSKVHKLVDMVSPFATNNWIIHDTNVQRLWNKLSNADKEIFYFNIRQLNWNEYLKVQYLGIRLHMMNDSLDTVDKAKKNKARLLWLYRFITFLFCFGMIQFLRLVIKFF